MFKARRFHKILLTVFLCAGIFQAAQAEETSTEEISAEKWTSQVTFEPDLSSPALKGARKVKARNVDEFGSLVPGAMRELIKKYGLKLKLTNYQAVHPSEGYIEATNEYRGKVRLIDIGAAFDKRGLAGYVAGLPFPKPSSGLEVAWNFHYAYGGDDVEIYYTVYWVSVSGGVEHSEHWRLSMIRGSGRTDIEPIPAIESMQEKKLQGAGLTYALEPYDKKGFGAVYFKSIEPRDGQGHTYVPAMRRILRNSFGTRGDSWNGTDLFFEDVRGYSGYPEWMTWKLLDKRTVLLPMHSGIALGRKNAKKAYKFDKAPYFAPLYEYEPRPVYVLEARPKLPDYPYSRQVLYVDGETFHVLYKQAYDKKGDLWKVMVNAACSTEDIDSGEDIMSWCGTVLLDVQSEHATVFHVHSSKANVDLDPDMFTVSSLRKRAR